MAKPGLVHHVPRSGTGPVTHAIIIGVSDYPHLQGGSGALAERTFGLGQLTSPAVSARELATWFIKSFTCLDRPLSSVWLLTSEPGAAAATFLNPASNVLVDLPRATLAETRNAVRDCLALCTNPDDRLIFYFCGHGLSGGMQNFYCLRDFGSDDEDPLGHAINYQNFAGMLEAQKPSNQLLLFDACRDQDAIATANQAGGSALGFADPNLRMGIVEPMRQCAIFSTGKDSKSYGKPNQPSLCASALLRGIRGAAARNKGHGWEVTSSRLLEAVTDFQALAFAPTADSAQKGDVGRFADISIRRLPGAPKIPVFIRRADGLSLKDASIKGFETLTGTEIITVGKLPDDQWEGECPIGAYRFEVSPTGAGAPIEIEDMVAPTHLPINVEIP